jgi:hypothetical protein
MKLLAISIAILCLIIFVSLLGQPSLLQRFTSAQVPTIDYCELLRSPATYDQKVIRLNVVYIVGFETSTFDSSRCNTQTSTWVEQGFLDRDCTNSEIRETLKKRLDAPPPSGTGFGSWKPIITSLTVTGQFQGLRAEGYGHMNAYTYSFTIQCVEQITDLNT